MGEIIGFYKRYWKTMSSKLSRETTPSPQSVCLCLATQSCPTLCNLVDCSTPGFSVHGDSPGKNTSVGWYALLQARILVWVGMPFSRGFSQPRDRTQVFSCIASGFFTIWAIREALPCTLVVKNLPSNARDVGLIPDGELGYHMPELWGQKTHKNWA